MWLPKELNQFIKQTRRKTKTWDAKNSRCVFRNVNGFYKGFNQAAYNSFHKADPWSSWSPQPLTSSTSCGFVDDLSL